MSGNSDGQVNSMTPLLGPHAADDDDHVNASSCIDDDPPPVVTTGSPDIPDSLAPQENNSGDHGCREVVALRDCDTVHTAAQGCSDPTIVGMPSPNDPVDDEDCDGDQANPSCDENESSESQGSAELNYAWRGEEAASSPQHLILQLNCHPPTNEQLQSEQASIYSGLVMIESKSSDVTEALEGIELAALNKPYPERSVKEDSLATNDPVVVSEQADVTQTEPEHPSESTNISDDTVRGSKAECVSAQLEDPRMLGDRALYITVDDGHFLIVGSKGYKSLTPKQYGATNELHRVLVNEHFDLTLVSLHPASPVQLRNFPKDQNVDERVWEQRVFAHLHMLRDRLPESSEHLDAFIYYAYGILTSLQELPGASWYLWATFQAKLAYFRMEIETQPGEWQYWKTIAEAQHAHALSVDSEVAACNVAICKSSNCMMQLLRQIQSLAVTKPCSPDREYILNAMRKFVTLDKASVIQQKGIRSYDEYIFFSSATHLLLALFDPMRSNSLAAFRQVLAQFRAIDSDEQLIKHSGLTKAESSSTVLGEHVSGKQSEYDNSDWGGEATASHQSEETPSSQIPGNQTLNYKLRPSPELGIVLCRFLSEVQTKSTTQPSISPLDLMLNDQPEVDSVKSHAAQLLSAVALRIFFEPDTSDIKLWEFIHVLLVSMHTVQYRPDWRLQFGYAFHAELLAPILNVLLHQAQAEGGDGLARLFRTDFPVMCSPLNRRHRLECCSNDCKSGVFNGDMKYCTEAAGVTGNETIPSDNSGSQVAERQFTCPLPEDYLLQEFFFGSKRVQAHLEAESKASSEHSTSSSIRYGSNIEATVSDVPKTKESSEMNTAEDLPPCSYFFPKNWFDNSKYDMEERRVRQNYVQDIETVKYREHRILSLLIRLVVNGPLQQTMTMEEESERNGFFSSHQNEHGTYYVTSCDAANFSTPCFDLKLPAIVQRDGGGQFVFIDPSLHTRVAKIDAGWQKPLVLKETDSRVKTSVPTHEAGPMLTHDGKGGEAAARSPLITSAWDLEMNGKACDDGTKLHLTPKEAGMDKATEGIPLTEDALGQLDCASTSEESMKNAENARQEAGSDKPEEGDSDSWTLVDIESIVSTDCVGWPEGWFSRRFGRFPR